jgi:hypothetical protein
MFVSVFGLTLSPHTRGAFHCDFTLIDFAA